MVKSVRRGRLDTTLLVLATTLGALPVALLASALCARFLPLSADARFAVGFGLAIPIWVTVMCFTLLSRTGARALTTCLGLGALLAVLLFTLGH
jgi:hypothetical protein